MTTNREVYLEKDERPVQPSLEELLQRVRLIFFFPQQAASSG
jgi:hypothetical protein